MTKLNSRLNFYAELVEYIYANQKEIQERYDEATETGFFTKVETVLGSKKYKNLSFELACAINELLNWNIGKKLTYEEILCWLLPGYDR